MLKGLSQIFNSFTYGGLHKTIFICGCAMETLGEYGRVTDRYLCKYHKSIQRESK